MGMVTWQGWQLSAKEAAQPTSPIVSQRTSPIVS